MCLVGVVYDNGILVKLARIPNMNVLDLIKEFINDQIEIE